MILQFGAIVFRRRRPLVFWSHVWSLVLRPQGKVLGLSLSLSESELQAITTMAQQQMPGPRPGQGRPARPATKR